MDYSTQQISELFDKLPTVVQDAIYNESFHNQINKIADKYKVSDIDADKLEGEALLVVINATKPEEFEAMISKRTAIDKQKTKNVSDEVMQTVVLPLLKQTRPENSSDKESILNDIENPTPVKPIIVNPAGINPLLDGQNNLPEGERKMPISSAAVLSRGPLVGNVKGTPLAPVQGPIIKPAQTAPAPKNYSSDPYREPAV